MSSWTVESIGDQTGKTAIVTGANSGVGLHTAAALVANGAHVVMACRDLSRSAPALDRVRTSGPGTVELRELNLADLASVAAFADGINSDFERLDVLVNNAGIMGGPRRETAQGYELQVGTNHLGHFALTAGLWPLLEAAPEARVVALTSLAARGGTLEPGMQTRDLTDPDPYKEMTVYSNSKQANLLFSQELHRRSAAISSNVQSFAAHPGVSSTNLFTRQLEDRNLGFLAPVANGLGKVLFQSSTAGATPAIRAATDPTIPSGSFIGPDALGQTRGAPEVIGVYRTGRNPETAAELWDLSEQLTDTTLLS
jgi:NAD(P)-dependent dehydrogenase (short-subunit alcohol dehydrogenase family)